MIPYGQNFMRNHIDLRTILLLHIYGPQYLPYTILRVNVIVPNFSTMPLRNFHRKDRRHHIPNDSTIHLLPGRNQAQHSHRRDWCKTDSAETIPRLGEHTVSKSNDDSIPRKHRGPSVRFSTSCQKHGTPAGSGFRDYSQKECGVRFCQSNSQVVTLIRSEIKEYLLSALEEGKRRMDDWITSKLEREAADKRGSASSDLCMMDWQPEKTIVIPQVVDIRYPWDCEGDTKWERWGGWKTRDARDWILEGMS